MRFKYQPKKIGCANKENIVMVLFGMIMCIIILIWTTTELGIENLELTYILALPIAAFFLLRFIYLNLKPRNSKYAKPIETDIELKKDHLWTEETGNIHFETLHLDIYLQGKKFWRYHLWDDDEKLAIYSQTEDDLMEQLSDTPIEVNHFLQVSANGGYNITVKCTEGYKLLYDLEIGYYKFINRNGQNKEVMPKYYIIDPNYNMELLSQGSSTVLPGKPDSKSDENSENKSDLDQQEYKERVYYLNSLINDNKGLSRADNDHEIRRVLKELCATKENTQYLLSAYTKLFKKDLVKDLINLSNKFSTIKEYCEVFIFFNIVSDRYPHKRLNKIEEEQGINNGSKSS